MSDIFISYSRKDIAFARLLHNALKDNSFETWIDWQDIPPSVDWLKEVFTAIEQANTFIFILSSESTLSDVCKLEIEHARKNNKRLIPILIDEISPSSVHPALAALNWIFSRTDDEFQSAIEQLITAIQTDYEWVKSHTRLQVRALEWERSEQDRSYLLQGTDLRQAENWLGDAEKKTPEPTLLHTRYIQASRQETAQKQRRLLMAAGIALLVTIVLGLVAFINGQRATSNAQSLSTQIIIAHNAEATAEQEAYFRATQQTIAEEQREIAVEQKNKAEARELAALSLNMLESNLSLAHLLAVEGYKKDANNLTLGSLLSTLQQDAYLVRNFQQPFMVLAIEYLPDGTLFASSGDRLVHFWNPLTGAEDGEPLIGHLDVVKDIAIHPDGSKLASASQDGSVRLWDVETRTEIEKLLITTSNNQPEVVAFSKDGNLLVCSTLQGEVWVWDTKTLKILTPDEKPIILGQMLDILFTQDNQYIITNSDKFGIELWEVNTGTKFGEILLNGNTADNIYRIALRPDGQMLAGSDYDGNLYFWDLATLKLLFQVNNTGEDGFFTDIVFHPNSQYLFSIDEEAIKYWSSIDGKFIGIFQKANRSTNITLPIDRLLISPDGAFLVWGDTDGNIKMREIFKHSKTRDPFYPYSGLGSGLAYSPDGKFLAATGKDDSGQYLIHLWDVPTMAYLENIPLGNTADIDTIFTWVDDFLFFHPDGFLIFAGLDDEIRFFDAQNFEPFGKTIATGEKVIDLVLSPDGKLLAVATQTSLKIQLWELETRELLGEFTLDPVLYSTAYFQSMAFSPDGHMLICGHDYGLITFWDIENKTQIGDPLKTMGAPVNHLVFSSEGSFFASAIDNQIQFWDSQTRYSIGSPMIGHTSEVTKILFNQDDSILISADKDGEIRLWDVATQQPIGFSLDASNARRLSAYTEGSHSLLGLPGHENHIQNMIYSVDVSSLTVKDSEGVIRIWDLDIESWLNTACFRAGRNLTENEWLLYFPGEPYRVTCPQYKGAFSEKTASEPAAFTGFETRIRERDMAVEVFVPAGEFQMGHIEWTDPVVMLHNVYLDDYWMDQTEVTNAQYALCVAAGVCGLPANNGSQTRASAYYGVTVYENFPVINVTWQQAMDYCEWVGGRLPSESEWEKAAKGLDNRIYPWGDQGPTSKLVNFSSLVGDTTAVGSYPEGVSPFGALDMAGNVSEWLYDYYAEDYYENSPKENPMGPENGTSRVFRGGSWNDVKRAYTWFRSDAFIGYFSDEIGFRCRTAP